MKISKSELKELVESMVAKKILKEAMPKIDTSDIESDSANLDSEIDQWIIDMTMEVYPATYMLGVVDSELRDKFKGVKISKATKDSLNSFVKILKELSKVEVAYKKLFSQERAKFEKDWK